MSHPRPLRTALFPAANLHVHLGHAGQLSDSAIPGPEETEFYLMFTVY